MRDRKAGRRKDRAGYPDPTRLVLRRRLSSWLLAVVTAAAARLLAASFRLRIAGDDPFRTGSPVILALWHHALYVAVPAYRGRRLVVGVSPSRAGTRLEAVLSRLGYAPSVRGSILRRTFRKVLSRDHSLGGAAKAW